MMRRYTLLLFVVAVGTLVITASAAWKCYDGMDVAG